jgi:hypothetical protein
LAAHDWCRTRNGQIARQLRTIVSVAYNKTPLRQVVADLARRGRFPAVIDEQGFADERIEPDSPITFTLKRASIETVLGLILREPLRLEWVVRNGQLVVTTQTIAHIEGHGSTESTRVLDVRRLRELEFQVLTRWLRPHGEFSNGFEHPSSSHEDEWFMLDADAPAGTELFGEV